MKLSKITLTLAIILVLALSSSTVAQEEGSPGCCCNEPGQAQVGSFQFAGECDATAGYSFIEPPTEFFVGRSLADSTVCNEFCGIAKPPEIIDVVFDCGNVNYKPGPENIAVKPVRGKPQFQLTWANNCTEYINVFEISRCEGEGCTNFQLVDQVGVQTSFTDPAELTWDTHYVYQLKTLFQFGESEPILVPAYTGDVECQSQETDSPFCISLFYYAQAEDYLKTYGYLQKTKQEFVSDFDGTVTD